MYDDYDYVCLFGLIKIIVPRKNFVTDAHRRFFVRGRPSEEDIYCIMYFIITIATQVLTLISNYG